MGDVSLNPQPLINDEPLTLPATAAKVIDQDHRFTDLALCCFVMRAARSVRY